MVDLVGIVEQNENLELSNQSIILDMSEQSCNLLQGNNQFDQALVDFESGYFINTKQLYKIWFNKDSDIFLSELNKNRLIDLRNDNPKAEISLLYSAERLSDNAKNEMQNFLSANCIKAVDFDQIYKETKNDINVSSTELKILSLAKEELDNFAKGNGGGNPAAASDLLRVSKTVIEKLGIYSDFDVYPKFDNFPLFQKIESSFVMPKNNNDFLAFSCRKDCKSINLEAEKELVQIQESIIKNYHSYANDDSSFKLLGYINENNSVTEARAFIKNMNVHNLFRYFYLSNYMGVFNFKETLSERDMNLLNQLEELGEMAAIELFFELSVPHSIAYYLAVLSNYHRSNWITYNFIVKKISQEPQAYGINSETLKTCLSDCVDFIAMELYKIKDEEYESYDFVNSPTEYQKDNLLDDNIKKKYYELFISALLEDLKYSWYSYSIKYFSGPEVLLKLFKENRDKYSPDANYIKNGIIRDGLKQDGSWYLNKL